MTRQEFNAMAKQEIPWSVYVRIEADYMESDKPKAEFVKAYGKNGIIKAYHAELCEVNGKLEALARRAISALDRMDSRECCDEKGDIVNYDHWGMLDTQLSLACDVLGIDRYMSHVELRNALLGYMRV